MLFQLSSPDGRIQEVGACTRVAAVARHALLKFVNIQM